MYVCVYVCICRCYGLGASGSLGAVFRGSKSILITKLCMLCILPVRCVAWEVYVEQGAMKAGRIVQLESRSW